MDRSAWAFGKLDEQTAACSVVGLHRRLFVDGEWVAASGTDQADLYDPSNGLIRGRIVYASEADLDRAIESSQAGFQAWRKRAAFNRCQILRTAAGLLRERGPQIAALVTREQGKPLREAGAEIELSADLLDWFAEEGRRVYGRLIPARGPGINQFVMREPIGPVVAFTPTTFPVSQAIHKIGPALAAGCSVILRPPDELSDTTVALVDTFRDAGLPPGVLNVVFGDMRTVAERLIAAPAIRMVSFMGAATHGKHLAMLAGMHMKRSHIELAGHSAAIVFDDADVDEAVKLLAFSKYRNCGQACVTPTRFMIQTGVYSQFKERFVVEAGRIRIGSGDRAETKMGPLVSQRRLEDVEAMIDEALACGAQLELGGRRTGHLGNFLEPTILSGVTADMRVTKDQLFGPVALLSAFEGIDAVIAQSNAIPYGRAAYAFTTSSATAAQLAAELQVGMLSINHLGLELPETPFGGIKDGGFGSEGGAQSVDSYLVTKFVSHALA